MPHNIIPDIDGNNDTNHQNGGAPTPLVLQTHEEASPYLDTLRNRLVSVRKTYNRTVRPIRDWESIEYYYSCQNDAVVMFRATANKARAVRCLQKEIVQHTIIARDINELIESMEHIRTNVHVCIAGGYTCALYVRIFAWMERKINRMHLRVNLITSGTQVLFDGMDELDRLP